MSAPESHQLRLFFALWPDEELRQTLAKISYRLAEKHPGIPMRPENLHITLAFLGNVAKKDIACLITMADAICFNPFTIILDQIDEFPRAKIIWAGMSTEPVELIDLAKKIHTGALSCNCKLDCHIFKPHLTLLRKTKHLDVHKIQSLSWRIDDFCLISSVNKPEGVQYQVLQRWPCS